ncbi:MAG: DUF1592 domain-containing protein [Planctomycetota bacterium]|nr:MAG: DUF1592 domain-containing protein [Planctomycetota bacterium]REK22747.1 MAG: DUF1592 domain-containing protein [Planctomycetota bacterium]REK33833.1 MAG: DUF1592 domain-containing protein [Planctomycetota bacterium]
MRFAARIDTTPSTTTAFGLQRQPDSGRADASQGMIPASSPRAHVRSSAGFSTGLLDRQPPDRLTGRSTIPPMRPPGEAARTPNRQNNLSTPVRVRCPHCASVIKATDRHAGKRARCPNRSCRKTITIPESTPPTDLTNGPECPPSSGLQTLRPGKRPAQAPQEKADQAAGWSAASPTGRIVWLASSAATGLAVMLLAAAMQPGAVDPLPDGATQAAAAETERVLDYTADVGPFFKRYCLDCHEGEAAEAGLDLARYDSVESIQANREHWMHIFDRIRVGSMPPSDADQPPDEERERVTAWLDHALFYVDCGQAPDPGRVTIRRLNRAEYNNTIRDLLGVDFEPAADFPSDDIGYGFDNIGDVLSIPPLLVEKYLDAAEEISRRAIVTLEDRQIRTKLAATELEEDGAVYDGPYDSKIMVSRGSVSTTFDLPAAGEYLLRIEAGADQAGDEKAKMELRAGDRKLAVVEVTGDRTPDVYEHRFEAEPGRMRLSAGFINDYYNKDEKADRNLLVKSMAIEGPLGLPTELPESHRSLVVSSPDEAVSLEEAASENVRSLLERAFRRPVSDEEIAQYVDFVEMTVERGDSFERGMQVALQATLVSPHFLFRVETDKRSSAADSRHSLNDFELASRLSYFLWSSMPDDTLFDLAEQGVLHEDAVLAQQVQRMMSDPKSYALIENFAGQWLNLRKLETNDVAPDPETFPPWDRQLRDDMWRETELFFASIVREDRPLTELLDGRYTFVNANLAQLYGIEGVEGDEFRRVELTDGRRAGVITQASVLTLTSYPTRTSPVKRGQWVLENILGDKPPDPPPVVPGLEETQQANPNLPLREQLQIHRSDPNCASCHVLMDDIGFGLENFDAIGRWREKDGEFELDTSGVLPTGEEFSGPLELVGILSLRRDEFTRCLAEKLLTYALGRGLEYYDKCTIDDIVAETIDGDYRFSALLTAIVRSEPFRMQRADASED